MSKTTRSSSRTHSQSASRSRSRSDSRSRSRSRSSSHSRSRKHRYGCRSRSRSRSHSPFSNRGRKPQREYQNHREFRGYHRGFRRPYFFRGRGRGYFRGRFQRGGGYNNYRSNNWQNFHQNPHQKQKQQQKEQQHAHSPNKGRSHTPKKHSSSPQSLGHSHRSDRSSSVHSHHSSSSSASRQKAGSPKQTANETLCAPVESQKSVGINGMLLQQGGQPSETEECTTGDKVPETWVLPVNHNSSRKASPQVDSAIIAGQDDLANNKRDPIPTSSTSTNWQTVASTPSRSSPKKSPTTLLSGFSNVEQEEDSVAMSMAFKKFLEEQKTKRQAAADKIMEKVAGSGNVLHEKCNSKSEGFLNQPSAPDLPTPAEYKKKQAEISKSVGGCLLNWPPFQCEDGEEEDGEDTEPHLPLNFVRSDAPKCKNKGTVSTRELFEEHVRRLEDKAWDDELEAFLLSREKKRVASILSALSKREKLAHKLGNLSPDRPSKKKRKEKSMSNPSPTHTDYPQRSSESQKQEIFVNLRDESPPRPSLKREPDISLRIDSLSNDLARSSVLASDWRNAMDLRHCDKKEQELHSVCHYLRCNNSCRSPSELFAQHVISILHEIKAQHFPSSGMTLNDRFAMYQRLAAEKELMKTRKSPEIHRRIDVSPSAFKRHSHLFDELKGSVDSSFKVDGNKHKKDTVDLRMDIEQRKKYLSRVKTEKDGREELGESAESSIERSSDKSSKHHKKSKKSKKKRMRSHSSSSSSCSSFAHEDEAESTENSFSKVQPQLRECVEPTTRRQQSEGFQFRIRGRGWSRVNSAVNNSSGNRNSFEMGDTKIEDWDPEHMAKSKKYYLQNDRDAEGDRKWSEPKGSGQAGVPRVKGRFVLRRPISSSTSNNNNWKYGKFQASGEDTESGNRDQREQNNT